MGFDQYHEPPDELPAQTRTFARMCASLTEEAEAIGWYEQRIAIETDREAVAVMRNAQGEEFKHFAMDLEYLLRRKPLWREIARGILVKGVKGAQRRVLALVELRADFAVAREELRAAERGAEDADLEALDEAALNIALAENLTVFHGWEEAGIAGIAEASSHDPLPLGDAANLYPGAVARGAERLLRAGIPRPYGLALGPECFRAVVETTEHGGYPVFEHLEHILGG